MKNTTITKTKKVAKATKEAKPMNLEAQVYTQAGKAKGTVTLTQDVFGLVWNADLVHQVVLGMQANARAGTAHTKDRGEVSGGGKKPWKQKGTGRARHGSSRSPIWVGGGVTFGPRSDKEYGQKINKKMRVKALFTVLSKKVVDGKVLCLDAITLAEIKTKGAAEVLNTLAKIEGFGGVNHKNHTSVLMVLSESNATIEKSFANLPGVTIVTADKMNTLQTITARNVILVDVEKVSAVLASKQK